MASKRPPASTSRESRGGPCDSLFRENHVRPVFDACIVAYEQPETVGNLSAVEDVGAALEDGYGLDAAPNPSDSNLQRSSPPLATTFE